MTFKRFSRDDYQAVCDFFVELNRDDKLHINWNWARFEWMYEHPEFDKSSVGSIGLWTDGGRVVGAAVYDMYFGEAFCSALRGYESLYPDILDYAYRELKDGSGLGISICDDNADEIKAAEAAGFIKAEQSENVMSIELGEKLAAEMPPGLDIVELDPAREPYEFQWLLWQGFDHGADKSEFEREDKIIPQLRPHLETQLSVAAVNSDCEKVAYCCLWYSPNTDYAYVEPVCTIPSYRGRGVSRALIYEALNRASSLGAKKAYVLSDMEFYSKLGFKTESHFTFYWRNFHGTKGRSS